MLAQWVGCAVLSLRHVQTKHPSTTSCQRYGMRGKATSTFKGALYSSVFILVLLCVCYDAIGQSFVLVIIVRHQGDLGFRN